LAAASENQNALSMLEQLSHLMSLEQIEEAKRLALEFSPTLEETFTSSHYSSEWMTSTNLWRPIIETRIIE